MIDIHIIRYHSLSKPEWFDRCVASVTHPKTAVHVINGTPKPHFGKLRVDAFKKGSGEFVSFIDDDDYLLPNAVDVQLKNIKDADFIISGYLIEGGLKASVTPSTLDYKIARKRLYYFQGFKLIRRKVVEKYYDILKDCEIFEDALLWCILTKKHKGVITTEPLLYRTEHSANVSKDKVATRLMNRKTFEYFISQANNV